MEETFANKKLLSLDQLVELAMECEIDDLPWDLTNMNRRQAYSMMACHVLDMLDQDDDQADKEIVMMTVMIRLLVENFFLNLMLNQEKKQAKEVDLCV